MGKFFESLLDPYFLLTAGFFAIVVNLISAYMKDPLDRVLGKVSGRWLLRTKKQEQRLYQFVDDLNDPEYRAHIRWISMMYATSVLLQVIFAFCASAIAVLIKAVTTVADVVARPWMPWMSYLMFAFAGYCLFRGSRMIFALVLQQRALIHFERIRLPPKNL